jgi:hypothetical protein
MSRKYRRMTRPKNARRPRLTGCSLTMLPACVAQGHGVRCAPMKQKGRLSLAFVFALSLSCGPAEPPPVAPKPAPVMSVATDAGAPAPASASTPSGASAFTCRAAPHRSSPLPS